MLFTKEHMKILTYVDSIANKLLLLVRKNKSNNNTETYENMLLDIIVCLENIITDLEQQ